MANRTATLTTSLPLTNVAAMAPGNNYIAERFAPPVTSRKQTGSIYAIDTLDQSHIVEDDVVAPGAEADLFEIAANDDLTYNCKKHALDGLVPDEVADQADAEARPAIEQVQILTEKILLKQEVLTQALAATMTAGVAVANGTWDDPASTPILDIDANKSALRLAGGIMPNVMTIDWDVASALWRHQDIVDRVVNVLGPDQTALSEVRAKILAQIFEFDEVLIARISRKNTAARGATATPANIWGKHAYFTFREAPRIRTANAVVTVHYNVGLAGLNERAGGVLGGFRVSEWREDARDSQRVRVAKYYDIKSMNANSGRYVANVIA